MESQELSPPSSPSLLPPTVFSPASEEPNSPALSSIASSPARVASAAASSSSAADADTIFPASVFSRLEPPPSLHAAPLYLETLTRHRFPPNKISRPQKPKGKTALLRQAEDTIENFFSTFRDYKEFNILVEITVAILKLHQEDPGTGYRADELFDVINHRFLATPHKPQDKESREIKSHESLLEILRDTKLFHMTLDQQKDTKADYPFVLIIAISEVAEPCLEILERFLKEIATLSTAEEHKQELKKKEEQRLLGRDDLVVDMELLEQLEREAEEEEQDEQQPMMDISPSSSRDAAQFKARKKRANLKKIKAIVLAELYKSTFTHAKELNNISLAPFICTCLVDEREPAVYLGALKRPTKLGGDPESFHVLASYFCPSPVLVHHSRVQFNFDHVSRLSPRLVAVHWDSGEVTIEPNANVSAKYWSGPFDPNAIIAQPSSSSASAASSSSSSSSSSFLSAPSSDADDAAAALLPIWDLYKPLFAEDECQWFEQLSKRRMWQAHCQVVKPVEWSSFEDKFLHTAISRFCGPFTLVPPPHIVCALSCLLTRKVHDVLKQLSKKYTQCNDGFPPVYVPQFDDQQRRYWAAVADAPPFVIRVDQPISLSDRQLISEIELKIRKDIAATNRRASSLEEYLLDMQMRYTNISSSILDSLHRSNAAQAEEKESLIKDIWGPFLFSKQWRTYIGPKPKASAANDGPAAKRQKKGDPSPSSAASSSAIDAWDPTAVARAQSLQISSVSSSSSSILSVSIPQSSHPPPPLQPSLMDDSPTSIASSSSMYFTPVSASSPSSISPVSSASSADITPSAMAAAAAAAAILSSDSPSDPSALRALYAPAGPQLSFIHSNQQIHPEAIDCYNTLMDLVQQLEDAETRLLKCYRRILIAFECDTNRYVKEVPRRIWFEIGEEGDKMEYKYRIDDISQGHNPIPIPAINSLNEEPFPPFTYVPYVVGGPDVPNHVFSMDLEHSSCRCQGSCGPTCPCVRRSGTKNAYDKNGLLSEEALMMGVSPQIVECTDMCGCPPDCRNKVFSKPMKWNLELRMIERKGWGVINVGPRIPKGSCMYEYTGEVLSDESAEKRGFTQDALGISYVFDYDHCEANSYSVDASLCGNVSRFYNHSCEGNLRLAMVFSEIQSDEIGHLVFFTTKDIENGEELTFDYKYALNGKGTVQCHCGSKKCRKWLR